MKMSGLFKGGVVQGRSTTEWLLLVARVIIKGGAFVAAYVCLTGMLVLVISDPILRYAVSRPLYWSNEVTVFLMIVMAFTGMGITMVKGQHVRVTLIFDRLPDKVQNVLWVLICLVTLSYVSILTYQVMRLALSSLAIGALTPTAEVPFFPWQMLATWGLIIFLVALVTLTVKRIAIALGLREKGERGKGLIDMGYD